MTKLSVAALAANLAGFLGKHSGELRLVGSALETIITHLPIDQADKAGILNTANALQTAAANIADGAAKLAELANEVAGGDNGPEVVIDRADVEKAVHDELVSEGVISNHGEATLAGNERETAGNA